MGIDREDGIQDLSAEAMKGGGIGFLGTGMGKLILLVLNVIIARFLGASGYGLYSIGSSIIRLVNPVGTLGLTSGIVRFGATHRSAENNKRIKGLFQSAVLISISISVLLAMAIRWASVPLAVGVFRDERVAPVIAWMALAIPFFSIFQLSASIAQVFKRIDLHQLINLVFRPAVMIVLVAVLSQMARSASGVASIYTIAAAITALFGAAVVYRLYPEIIGSLRPVFETRELLRFSIPVLLSGLLFILLSSLDRLMLGVLSSTEEVGVFSAAANVAQVMTLVLTAFIPISMIMMADLYSRNRIAELSEIYQSITRWILVLTLPAFLVVLFAAEEVMSIFGQSFKLGGGVLLVLSMGQLFNAGTGPVGRLMEMTGHQDMNAGVMVAMILMNGLLNLALIPIWGAMGAAVATTVATVLVFGMLVVIAGRQLGFQLLGLRMIRILAIAASAAIVGIGIRLLLVKGPMGAFLDPTVALSAVLVYGMAVIAVGLTDYDRATFQALWDNLRGRRI